MCDRRGRPNRLESSIRSHFNGRLAKTRIVILSVKWPPNRANISHLAGILAREALRYREICGMKILTTLFALLLAVVVVRPSQAATRHWIVVRFFNRTNMATLINVHFETPNGGFPSDRDCVLAHRQFRSNILDTPSVEVQALPLNAHFCVKGAEVLAMLNTGRMRYREPADVDYYLVTAELTESDGHFKLVWLP